ncbi:aminotransferase class V-fold PLP-dependent enzyme [uncultured Prevotella sp.]|uniref:trans-sulfuration enzyme family protein n=1 Tax=uncultured Prevotella sp. TaxID=159272 RepID=UPI0027E35635|nr:aminotransferase class V-fold PLP-dependent enzyme [uncultured Prevotella sp.]
MRKETKAIQTPFQKRDAYGSLSFPVYNTAAYEFDTAHDMTEAFSGRVLEPDYSRVMNPTVAYFENRVKALSGAENVFAMNTGMAAILNALLVFAEAGKTIVTSNHLFGNTYALITKTLARLGVKAQIADLTDTETLDRTIADDACLIFAEYITNPQLEVVDLKKLSQVAHKHGVPLIVDTTIVPFTELNAREQGVDVEVLSSTKYISGGATSLGGLILDYGTFEQVNKRIRFEFLFNIGSYMTPQVAYMQTLGLETLNVRYQKQAQNALDLARALQKLPEVKRVNYPGLVQGEKIGAMLTIDLESEQKCFDFINRLKLIRRATNLFDNKSLAIHPYSTIFVGFTPEEKKNMDVLDTTIRLSMGLEDVEDLLEDIEQALK